MALTKLSTHFLFTNNSGSLSWKTNTDHEIDASNKSQLINLLTISYYHLLLNHLITINAASLSNKQTNTDHENDAANKSQLQERGGLLADTGSFFETSLFKLVQTFSVLLRPTLTH